MLQEHSIELEKQVINRTEELVHTNLELVKQNNQLEQFGYIIAHNLRGPVARILGLSRAQVSSGHDLERVLADLIIYRVDITDREHCRRRHTALPGAARHRSRNV